MNSVKFFLISLFVSLLTVPAGAQYTRTDESAFSINERFRAVTLIGNRLGHRRANGRMVYPEYCRYGVGADGCAQRLRIFVNEIFDAAREEGIDPWLVVALTIYETNFDPNEESSIGHGGILRLRREWRGENPPEFFSNREACLRRADACQRPVIRLAVRAIAESIRVCDGNINRGLARYRTRDCDRIPRHGRQVRNLRDTIYRQSRELPTFCDLAMCFEEPPREPIVRPLSFPLED